VTDEVDFSHPRGLAAIPFESILFNGYDVVTAFADRLFGSAQGLDEVARVDSQIADFVMYPCPRCGVSLEANTNEWQDWLLCPSCGRAGRSPLKRRLTQPVDEDVLYIGTFTTGPGSSDANGAATGYPTGGFGGYAAPSSNARRMILGGGFFLAVVLTLVSVVQKNGTQAGILGLVALLLLVLLARSSGRS